MSDQPSSTIDAQSTKIDMSTDTADITQTQITTSTSIDSPVDDPISSPDTKPNTTSTGTSTSNLNLLTATNVVTTSTAIQTSSNNNGCTNCQDDSVQNVAARKISQSSGAKPFPVISIHFDKDFYTFWF